MSVRRWSVLVKLLFCLFVLMLYVPVNSFFSHVGTLSLLPAFNQCKAEQWLAQRHNTVLPVSLYFYALCHSRETWRISHLGLSHFALWIMGSSPVWLIPFPFSPSCSDTLYIEKSQKYSQYCLDVKPKAMQAMISDCIIYIKKMEGG